VPTKPIPAASSRQERKRTGLNPRPRAAMLDSTGPDSPGLGQCRTEPLDRQTARSGGWHATVSERGLRPLNDSSSPHSQRDAAWLWWHQVMGGLSCRLPVQTLPARLDSRLTGPVGLSLHCSRRISFDCCVSILPAGGQTRSVRLSLHCSRHCSRRISDHRCVSVLPAGKQDCTAAVPTMR
jgi:hypothetical protein